MRNRLSSKKVSSEEISLGNRSSSKKRQNRHLAPKYETQTLRSVDEISSLKGIDVNVQAAINEIM